MALFEKVSKEFSVKKSEQTSLNKTQISSLLDKIEPYIFGYTPLCKTLEITSKYFQKTYNNKVLFLLTDGDSTDGDPLIFCENIKKLSVNIFCCCLSESKIDYPKMLFDKPDPKWGEYEKNMFFMSSTALTSSAAMKYLIHNGWILPESGECRLFIRADNSVTLEEFASIVSKISESDAIIDIVGKVSLDQYINQQITDFYPREQKGGTCYANATAAVFLLHISL